MSEDAAGNAGGGLQTLASAITVVWFLAVAVGYLGGYVGEGAAVGGLVVVAAASALVYRRLPDPTEDPLYRRLLAEDVLDRRGIHLRAVDFLLPGPSREAALLATIRDHRADMSVVLSAHREEFIGDVCDDIAGTLAAHGRTLDGTDRRRLREAVEEEWARVNDTTVPEPAASSDERVGRERAG